MTTRRNFIGLAVSATTIGLSGCIGPQKSKEPTNDDNEEGPDNLNVESPEPASQQTFQDWEPDTNCEGDQPDAMINSEISITGTTDQITDKYTPIDYDSLPHSQREILAIVLTEGGYAICEESDAFQAFFQSAVQTGYDQEADVSTIYLQYDNTYYSLYLRRQDQVYSY